MDEPIHKTCQPLHNCLVPHRVHSSHHRWLQCSCRYAWNTHDRYAMYRAHTVSTRSTTGWDESDNRHCFILTPWVLVNHRLNLMSSPRTWRGWTPLTQKSVNTVDNAIEKCYPWAVTLGGKQNLHSILVHKPMSANAIVPYRSSTCGTERQAIACNPNPTWESARALGEMAQIALTLVAIRWKQGRRTSPFVPIAVWLRWKALHHLGLEPDHMPRSEKRPAKSPGRMMI